MRRLQNRWAAYGYASANANAYIYGPTSVLEVPQKHRRSTPRVPREHPRDTPGITQQYLRSTSVAEVVLSGPVPMPVPMPMLAYVYAYAHAYAAYAA
jgi:hypothetical protein